MSDGDKQRGPTITHRFTLCGEIYLDDVLAAISQCAFTRHKCAAALYDESYINTLYIHVRLHVRYKLWARLLL